MSAFTTAFFFVHVFVGTHASPLLISRLPDGVAISGAESLRQVVASWDVFVTLDPPQLPMELIEQVQSLEETFTSLASLEMGSLDLSLQAHRVRRDHLLGALKFPGSTGRVKRGLLDVGGHILHALFGVATSSQLHRFEAALSEISGNQQGIAHSTRQLTTIVNQTGTYLRAVVLRQHQMEINVLHINQAIAQLDQAVESQATRVRRLELLTTLDRYMDVLELATRQFTDQVALFNRQRSGLEQGHLSRDLLTPDQLRDILDRAAAKHQVVDNIEWYYSYITVSPIWRKTDNLLYHIEIPLISHRPYLLYHMAVHPVPINNSTFTVKLNLQDNYALDTVSGNLFVPQKCLGHSPILCTTGAEYDTSLMKCARGLITSQPAYIKTCKTTVTETDGQPIISTMALNQYAIATTGETLTVRCPGRRESHVALARGTYNVTCLNQCTIRGEGYQITCVDRLFVTRRFALPSVRVTAHFNFSSRVEIDVLRTALPQLQQVAAHPLMDLDVAMLLDPPSPGKQLPIRSRPSILALINLFVLMTVLISLSVVYWRHRLCRSRKTPVVGDTLTEALPLTTTPHEPTAPPRSNTGIWPSLPKVSNCTNHTEPGC